MEENNNNGFEVNPEVKQTNEQKVTSKKKSKLVPFLVVLILILIILVTVSVGSTYVLFKKYNEVLNTLANNNEQETNTNIEEDNTNETDTNIEEDNTNESELNEEIDKEELQRIMQCFFNISSSKEASIINMLTIEEIGLITEEEASEIYDNNTEKIERQFVFLTNRTCIQDYFCAILTILIS